MKNNLSFISHFPFVILSLVFIFGCKMNGGEAQVGHHLYTNELINESSPYLLQHAHNPVNWHAWNDRTIKQAENESKMLIISVGYAACHWCHVMEHESFEDTMVARVMNENFICVKVDREERPDVDDVYMTACQMSSDKGCGWPLNAFALPNGQPVWAGTYSPKKQWIEVLGYFSNEWKTNPEKMKEFAAQLTDGLKRYGAIPVPESDPTFHQTDLDKMAETLLGRIDFKKGGRQGAPKFPMPSNYEFLLKYHQLTEDKKSLEAVTLTLDEMAKGGLYDHLGGGFARYSTDADWLVPHFEKMLYDNGQLVSLYSNAYRLTKDPFYRKVVEETLDYVAREMTSSEGAFYSSLDADSEGEEGKFYVWTKSEIDSLLDTDAAVFNDYYNVEETGNWEHRQNILHIGNDEEAVAKRNNMDVETLQNKISSGKITLFNQRSKRVRPGLDDKALTSWNALMLTGYVDAYKAFGKQAYLDAALKNGQFIFEKVLQKDHRLNRNYKDGKSVINGFLDDYALTAQAFIELYQVTFDEKWLMEAKDLTQYALDHFVDPSSSLMYYTSDVDPSLVARKKETADNVIPGSNSLMANNLYKLGLYFYKQDWINRSQEMMHTLSATILESGSPDFYSQWCQVYLDQVAPPYEVAVVGDEAMKKSKELLTHYLPNAILLGGKDEGTLDLLKGKLQDGQTMIYVCRNKICKLPVEKVDKALELID